MAHTFDWSIVMSDQQINILTNVSEEEYKFDKYYEHALARKGLTQSWNQQYSEIQGLKELLKQGYIKKVPIILPMYQMPGSNRSKAQMIYYALVAADSELQSMPGFRDFFPKLTVLSFEYSAAGNAGKVAKEGIKAYYRLASKAVVKTAELIASPKRLTAIYYAVGIFFINRVLLKESQDTSEAEGLSVYKKALVAIDQGAISVLC